MMIQKNSKILVHVEEALADLIVVSYSADDKKFQGVLLDSNKGNLPFGVYNLHPAFTRQAASCDNNDDKLHSASQRYLYEDPDYDSKNIEKKKPAPKGKPQPRQKMTVRLRPRKVLCSNCKGICNENNENVDVSKKRKHDSEDEAKEPDLARNMRNHKFLMAGGMLIPKLSRLQPSEISSAIKGENKNSTMTSDKPIKSDNESVMPELAFVNVSDQDDKTKNEFNNLFSSARTLKICFGEGEGTVVKIPPLAGDYNEDSGVSCDMNKSDSKAAKKALKKAKKQAKRSVQIRTMSQSPKHIGALSPRNVADSPPSPSDEQKRQKHKVKHKKKYRAAKKRDENAKDPDIKYFSDIKDHCMNQKLSVNLQRLSNNSFEQANKCSGDEEIIFNSSDIYQKQGLQTHVKTSKVEAERNESLVDPLGSPSTLNTFGSPIHSLASPSTLAQSPRPVDVYS